MSNVIVSSGGTSGPRGNSVLNGSGAPANTVGIDGDWYIDTVSSNLYGPKAAGAWPGSNIRVASAGALLSANNLSDLASALTARTNLGLGGAATANVGTAAGTVAAGNDARITGAAQTANNLSDLANAGTARTNLGLGGASTLNVGTAAGTVAAGNDSRITGAAQTSNNLSDLASAPTARTNLGLGGAAVLNVGTTTGTVAAGDDSRITGALPATGGTVNGDLAITGKLTMDGFALPMFPRASRRPAYRAASWSQQFQTGHGWTASGSGVGSSNANDTVTFSKGTQSFQVVTTGTGAVANIRKFAGTVPDLTGKALRFTFRIADVTHLNQINVQVGTSSLGNNFAWRLHTHSSSAENQVLSGEWAVVTLSWADVLSAAGTYSISSTGVPSTTSGFTDLLVQFVDDNTGNALTVNLQSVEVINDSTDTFPSGVVSITFDDSFASQYTTARPKMDSYGYRGTLYTIVENIGTGGYLTLSQLQSVQNASGWEVAGHAYYSANHNAKYNTLTSAVVEDDIRRCRMWLAYNGFPSDSFAFPGGFFSTTTDSVSIESLACRYFSNGRGISSSDTLEPFPPAMPYRMRSITGIGALAGGAAKGFPANLTGAGGALDRCQLEGNWTILTFHDIVTGSVTASTQCSQTDFNSIMDAINSRGIPVLPVSDVLRLYS